jgi:Tfp pilus assembly protein PilN
VSVRLNLLPDLRQARLRDAQRRRQATVVAVVIWIVAGGVVLLLGLFNGAQKFTSNDLSKKITDKKSQLSSIDGLTTALTAQQHLAALPGLYDKRVYFTKFFTAYNQLSPGDITLSSLNIGADNIMKISGTATSFTSVAKLAKAMSQGDTSSTGSTIANSSSSTQNTLKPNYFTDVVIAQVTKTNSGLVNFSLTATASSGATSGK